MTEINPSDFVDPDLEVNQAGAPPLPPPPAPMKPDYINITRAEYYMTPDGSMYIVIEVKGYAGFQGTVKYSYHNGTRWRAFGSDRVGVGEFHEGDHAVGSLFQMDTVFLFAELLDANGNRVDTSQTSVVLEDKS